MKLKYTQRGYARAEFIDVYDNKCSIQKSSFLPKNCLWLGVTINGNGKKSSRMHLTQEMVAELLPLLNYFAEYGELPEPEE